MRRVVRVYIGPTIGACAFCYASHRHSKPSLSSFSMPQMETNQMNSMFQCNNRLKKTFYISHAAVENNSLFCHSPKRISFLHYCIQYLSSKYNRSHPQCHLFTLVLFKKVGCEIVMNFYTTALLVCLA